MGRLSAGQMPWVIFDIDGTLANITHRLCHLPDYDKFNSECLNDELKEDIKSLYNLCYDAGWNIAIMTGREAKWHNITTKWLQDHGIAVEFLLMRPTGDFRPDSEIKEELFNKHLKGKEIKFVVDDRGKVVDMWRRIGLTCLQCQKGDY